MMSFLWYLQTNTYSCTLVTNGNWTFALLHYPKEGITWTAGDDHGGTNGEHVLEYGTHIE